MRLNQPGHDRLPRLIAVVALIVLLAPACVDPPNPRVGLKPLTAELVFGIPPVEEPVAPPNTLPAAPPALALDSRDFGQLEQPRRFCPGPTTNDVNSPSDEKITGQPDQPKQGVFIWKLEGKVDYGPPVGYISLPTFDARFIFDIKPLTTKPDYTFKTFQFDLGTNDGVIMTWEVITTRSKPQDVVGPPPAGGNIIRDQGTSNINGIFLTEILRFNALDSAEGSTFKVNPPMLFLPIPVVPGYTRSQTAADPETLQTLQMDIKVRDKERFDGCEERLEGWFVDGFQTFTYTDDTGNHTIRRNFDYAIATQLGGIIVFEQVESQCATYDAAKNACTPPGALIYKTNIASLSPGDFEGSERFDDVPEGEE